MKQKITLAVNKSLLKRTRALAAHAYDKAKQRALARLDSPFHLGGGKMVDREPLHTPQNPPTF